MKNHPTLASVRRALLLCTVILALPLSGCAAAAMGVVSAATTAGSLAVSAASTATSAVYHVGKAAF